MTDTKIQAVSKRCAVAKIDLKGKFVYIDDSLEELFGEKRENLFGRDIKEFLTSESEQIINQIISVRNHYETFYEAATLDIKTGNDQLNKLRAVFSLNFASGNPVNFLVIIDPVPVVTSEAPVINKDLGYFEILSLFVNLRKVNYFKNCLEEIHNKSLAEHTLLYEFSGEDMKLINKNSEKDFNSDELSQLYYDIAAVGAQYSFLDKENVENALENYEYSPNEYILGFTLEDKRHLLRLVYADDYDSAKVEWAIKEIFGFINSIESFDKGQESDAGFIPDVKFTIGFLDSFKIAAFLTDVKGDVVGYNPSLLNFVDEHSTSGSYTVVLENLTDQKSSSLLKKTVEYLNSKDEKSKGENLHLVLKLSKGTYADLYAIPFSDDASDLSACFVLIPQLRLKEVDQEIFK